MSINAKVVVVVVAILGTIIATTLTVWFLTRPKSDVCITQSCTDAASSILKNMDQTVDPCSDFYQYACGGWIKNNSIPEDRSSISQFSLVEERMSESLRDILKTDYTNDRPAIKKAKLLYLACMDEETIEELGAKPALDWIPELGGFPLFGDDFNDSSFVLEEYLASTKFEMDGQSNSSPFLAIGVGADDKNSSAFSINMDQPILGLPDRDYFLEPELRNSTLTQYRQSLYDYIAELWKSKDEIHKMNTFNETELSRAIEEVLQIETDLAEILTPENDRLDVSRMYRKFSLKDMWKSTTNEFDWFTYVKEIMNTSGIEITQDTEVVSFGTPYFQKFMDVIGKLDPRSIKNYVMITALQARSGPLSKKFRDTMKPLRGALSGTSVEEERFHVCNGVVNFLMPMPVGALYVKKFFPESSREIVLEMNEEIMQAFKKNLMTLDWMDEKTQKAALVKAEAVTKLVGYPDYILEDSNTQLDDEYGFNVDEEEYFKSIRNISLYDYTENLKDIRATVDKKLFDMGPAVYNAYYDAVRNSMVLPAAAIQPPEYDVSMPFAMNYAGVGSTIGHELTHGFDTTGSMYDATGNLEKWWSNFSQTNFDKRADCMREQYSNFHYKAADMNIDGELTLGENIADNGAIRLSYDAYQLWKSKNPGKEFKLPGLEDFSSEKLFFLGHAQSWCMNERSEMAKNNIMTDSHSPASFRVDGTFMNYDKFGEAFNCKRGVDRMFPRPDDTCRVW